MNFVNDIVTKIKMGEVYRVLAKELSDKIDGFLENEMDGFAEVQKAKLVALNKKIKECEAAEEELLGMIERAKLTPLEYLLFELRYMHEMKWNDIIEKIASTPELKQYERSRENYFNVLKRATKKLKEAGE